MMAMYRTAVELDAERDQFLSQPHSTKALWAEAKKAWEDEHRKATRLKKDRWPTLTDYKFPKKGGKKRPLGREIISMLRKHLAKLQGNRCCYCRRWLQNIAHARPVEHILSRKEYPQFSLHYWNMALCCRDCNQLKGKKKWGTLALTAVDYPTTVGDYFHPRLHIYDGHVRYVRLETNDTTIAIYHGLSAPGRQLCRDHLKTISQVDALIQNNPRVRTAVETLQLAGENVDPGATQKLNEFIDAMHQAVHRIAQKATP
ncbi:hypothetical protein GJ699_07170 [Duganella sp. FT80W]|uniref:TIGR02646 family protein n=1 Tax=Duganella guangzhouensis TaxID=2666084 RepID=A0A6I2KW60_9BURK|nr:hypothetical protein [Duganella guangzhouensis]MRW89760.1 hypothetical protein [Duganella guangzhouensis]